MAIRQSVYGAPQMPTLERHLDERLVNMLKRYGAWSVQTTRLAPVKRGIPDRLICHRGLHLAIELKGDMTPHKPLQDVQRQRVRDAGGISFYARGEDGLEFVELVLRKIDNVMASGGVVMSPQMLTQSIHIAVESADGVGL